MKSDIITQARLKRGRVRHYLALERVQVWAHTVREESELLCKPGVVDAKQISEMGGDVDANRWKLCPRCKTACETIEVKPKEEDDDGLPEPPKVQEEEGPGASSPSEASPDPVGGQPPGPKGEAGVGEPGVPRQPGTHPAHGQAGSTPASDSGSGEVEDEGMPSPARKDAHGRVIYVAPPRGCSLVWPDDEGPIFADGGALIVAGKHGGLRRKILVANRDEEGLNWYIYGPIEGRGMRLLDYAARGVGEIVLPEPWGGVLVDELPEMPEESIVEAQLTVAVGNGPDKVTPTSDSPIADLIKGRDPMQVVGAFLLASEGKWTEAFGAMGWKVRTRELPALSSSQLGTLDACDVRWLAEYGYTRRGGATPPMKVGGALHALAEAVLTESLGAGWGSEVTRPTRERLEALAPEEAAKRKLKPDETKMVLDGIPGLVAHLEVDGLIAVEHRWKLDIGGVETSGIMDAVYAHPQRGVEVKDWKTGQNVPSRGDVDRDPQVALYLVAARRLWPVQPPRKHRLTLVYVARGIAIPTDWTPELERWVISMLQSADRRRHQLLEGGGGSGPEAIVNRYCSECPVRTFCPAYRDALVETDPFEVAQAETLHTEEQAVRAARAWNQASEVAKLSDKARRKLGDALVAYTRMTGGPLQVGEREYYERRGNVNTRIGGDVEDVLAWVGARFGEDPMDLLGELCSVSIGRMKSWLGARCTEDETNDVLDGLYQAGFLQDAPAAGYLQSRKAKRKRQ